MWLIRREGIDTGVGAKSDVAHVDDFRREYATLSQLLGRNRMTAGEEMAI